MAKRKRSAKAAKRWPFELRLLGFVLRLAFWHLPRLLWRCLARLAGWLGRRAPVPETAAEFYRSYRWRRLRIDVLEENRAAFGGGLTCECCGDHDAARYHVDHIYPRSSHPELALIADNLQVLCDACNIGKATHYTTNWRDGPLPSLAARLRQWLAPRSSDRSQSEQS